MKKSLIIIFSFIAVIVLGSYILSGIEVFSLRSIGDETYVSKSDIYEINSDRRFGKLVKAEILEDAVFVDGGEEQSGEVVFKLFGFIPIKRARAEIIGEDEVYVGGNPVGFSIDTKGVIVTGKNSVLTMNGLFSPLDKIDVRVGDVIQRVNGKNISSIDFLTSSINSSEGELLFEGTRNGEAITFTACPVIDENSGLKKIGLWVRDDASGIGTLTFASEGEMRFGALGHPIKDSETGSKVDVEGGSLHACSIVSVEKSTKGSPGEIKAIFQSGHNSKKGEIESGTNFGIFGKITNPTGIIDTNKKAKIGGRLGVKPGKAKIVSTISGTREEYDIEILKVSKQKIEKDKSFVINVTDRRLIELTGGIVQGMSGSPILQNGKLVGALTHVFVSDAEKGYCVYIDWMKNYL